MGRFDILTSLEDPKKPDVKPQEPKPKKPQSKKTEESTNDTMIPRHHDTTVPRYHDTTVSREEDDPIEVVRRAVKQIGKEAATHRFTQQEKAQLADIEYT